MKETIVFNETQLGQAKSAQSYPLGMNPGQPPEIGINSTVKELMAALSETERAISQVLEPFGMSTPEGALKDVQPTNLREMIGSAAYRLQSVNSKLDRMIQHLNS
jgi:hypothetical protein